MLFRILQYYIDFLPQQIDLHIMFYAPIRTSYAAINMARKLRSEHEFCKVELWIGLAIACGCYFGGECGRHLPFTIFLRFDGFVAGQEMLPMPFLSGPKGAGPSGDKVLRQYRRAAYRRNFKLGHYDPGHSFNDMHDYLRLRKEHGCVWVDIHSVRVRHSPKSRSMCCHGIQVTYKQWFRDGSTKLVPSLPHFASYGDHAKFCDGCTEDTTLVLQDGEYITGIRFSQKDVLKDIIFVTNLRQVHCGYSRLALLKSHTTMLTNPPNTRIIAFCGILKGVWERVGYYAEHCQWETFGPYMLRELICREQACSIENNDVLQRVVADEGLFRAILSFL